MKPTHGRAFEPDAALIAAMHDALPALLDVVEAVQDWFEGEGFDRLVPEFFANGSPGWKYRRIWQTLAKLSAITDGNTKG